MEGAANFMCAVCYSFSMCKGDYGEYYCSLCGTQSQTVKEESLENDEEALGIYSLTHTRRNLSQSQNQLSLPPPPPQSQEEEDSKALLKVLMSIPSTAGAHLAVKVEEEGDEFQSHLSFPHDVCFFDSQPPGPVDFAGQRRRNPNKPFDIEEFATEIKMTYVEGIQIMIQLQCEALVSKLGIGGLVCGVAGLIWLRFLAKSRILQDGWAREVLLANNCLSDYIDANAPARKRKQNWKLEGDPHINLKGKRVNLILKDALRDRIPLSISLVVSFLACHIAREPILPTDIIKWAIEGKLPYITAFVDIEKRLLVSRRSLPVESKFLFGPHQMVGSRQLESMSGLFSRRIGLKLPYVNYLSISCRFLTELRLPTRKLFEGVRRFYEWTIFPGLWISADFTALPTRVYVMSVLVIVIKVLYKINGQGYWEEAIIENASRSDEDNVEASKLLRHLNSWYQSNSNELEFEKDMYTYLKYCQKVVFAGCKLPFDEENLASHLWKLSETSRSEDFEDCNGAEENGCFDPIILNLKDLHISKNDRNKTNQTVEGSMKTFIPEDQLETSNTNAKEKKKVDVNLRRLVSEMIKDGFRYLPPSDHVSQAYFRYRKTKCNGSVEHLVHADYYILLRACAKAIKVKTCMLHICVLNIEKLLVSIEEQITATLQKQ